jgi:hypothetical protein
MQMYLRLLPDQISESHSASEEQQLHESVVSAPGVASVTKIERHVRGGYAVIVERDGTVDEVLAHLTAAGYTPVL